MMRRGLLAFLATLALVLSARADIADPSLTGPAEAYRETIGALAVDRTVEQVLAALNEARRRGDPAAIVRESEALAALGGDNAQAWMALARAWLETDRAAAKGLAAAIRASQLTAPGGDRLEALLLASTFLRGRLAAERERQEAAVRQGAEAAAGLAQAEDLARNDSLTGPDADNPDGRIAALKRTMAEAGAAAAQAAADIALTAASLDEVYREISGALPGVDAGQLAAADGRLGLEIVESEPGTVTPRFVFSGTDVRVCVRFSKALKQNSRVYADFVSLNADNEPLSPQNYDVLAEGDQLCLLRLVQGPYYDLTFAAGLPAGDDTLLAEAQQIYFGVDDSPARIGFGAAEVILPRSGPGELPVSLTNLEEVPLAIHRVVDRSLNRHIALGHLRNGVSATEYRQLLRDFSEVLWEGRASRPLGADERNTLVQTFVPVRSILDDRRAWVGSLDRTAWERSGEVRSMTQPVRNITDDKLAIEGRFVAGKLDVAPETADLYVPGIYALVAPVPDTGPNRDFHCAESGDDNCQAYAAQWFIVSDIGLGFYEGEREFTVLARSLASGGPVAGARVQLVSRGNRVLAEGETDANGLARFSRTLTAGDGSNALVAILAEADRDFNFLEFAAERLDLSRLNVGGQQQEAGGAFLYTDRGVYQPGETAQVLALLRERGDAAAPGMQLRLEIADAVVKTQPVDIAAWKDGGLLEGVAIPATARPGGAVLKLVSPANETLAEARIRIDRIRPDRARIAFESGPGALAVATSGNSAEVSGRVRVQYLYGSLGSDQGAASNLKAEVTVRVAPMADPFGACFAGYQFGRFDDPRLQTVSRNFVEYTDAEGALSLRLAGVRLPESTRPLAATVEVTVFDASGPLAAGQAVVAVPTRDAALGLAPLPRISASAGGAGYALGLDLALLGRDGTALAGRDVEIRLEREHEAYAWENVDGVWQHVRLQRREDVATRVIPLSQGSALAAPAGCAAAVRLDDVATGLAEGRYVVTATEPVSGAVTTLRFNTGAAQTSPDDLEPNIFVLSSDKERYAPGETVTLTVQAPFAEGEVLVAVAGRDVLAWHAGSVRNGVGTVSFAADAAWSGRGLHALATAFKKDDGARALGPARAIGAAYLEVTSDARSFDVSIRRESSSLEDVLRPGETLAFDVCVGRPDGACGEGGPATGYAVAFVVDEGLLSLTGHEAEMDAMDARLLGREKLALRLMDNYGRLLLREGGDRPGRLALSNYTSTRIVAMASGPVALTGGKARFSFEGIDMQSGSLKIFAVAWNATQVGGARQTLPVRNMLVSQLGVPEFFLAGDRPLLPLRLENVSFLDHRGDYAMALTAGGGIRAAVVGRDGNALPTDAQGRFLAKVPAGAPQDVFLSLDIPETAEGEFDLAMEMAAIDAQADLPAAERRRSWTLAVRPSGVMAQQYLSFPLGNRPVDLAGLLGGLVEGLYVPETVKVVARFASSEDTLRLASVESGSANGGVLDEVVWQGMVDLQEPATAADMVQRASIQTAVDAVQALQLPDGAFVPYRARGEFIPSEVGFDKGAQAYTVRHGLLRNVSALDFLLRARAAGFAVAPDAVRNALTFVRGRVDEAVGAVGGGEGHLLCTFDTRYAMLVLVQQDRLTENDITALDNCVAAEDDGEGVAEEGQEEDTEGATPAVATGLLSDLVDLAVFRQYGEEVDTDETLSSYYDDPAAYLSDLDDYRRAIGLSMLANAGADRRLVQTIAAGFARDGKPLDLRTRAWLARSAADIGASAARLAADNIDASDPDLMVLQARADGVVESGEMAYAEIERAGLTVGSVGGPEARGFLRVGGRLVDAEDRMLPASALRQRLFDARTGREIDPEADRLEVGQRLVVAIEATAEAFEAFADMDTSDIGSSYGPLVVQATLPSALTLTGDDISGVRLRGDLDGFRPVGNLRSVETGIQAWSGIIVPVTSNAVTSHSDGDGEGEAEAEAPVADGIEFRQAFVATVTAAGSFRFPPITVDPLDHPGDTLLSRLIALTVAVPGDDPR
jgi:uncharacterized protein YfaS (alpha-2-macroglobulin family)